MASCTHLEHLQQNPPHPTPSGQGCEDCLKLGRHDWVHLRICLECGHVGCCDSSPGKHATQHYRETGHRLVQSFELGEYWVWCYEDKAVLMLKQKFY